MVLTRVNTTVDPGVTAYTWGPLGHETPSGPERSQVGGGESRWCRLAKQDHIRQESAGDLVLFSSGLLASATKPILTSSGSEGTQSFRSSVTSDTGTAATVDGTVATAMNTVMRAESIHEVVADFRDSMLPVDLAEQLCARENANRIYVAVTLQPEGVLWQGIRDRVRCVDAVCARAGTKHVAALVDEEIISESLDKCALPFFGLPRGLLHDRMRWALSVLRGHQGDARTMWAGRTANEAHFTLTTTTTDRDAAHFLVLQALGSSADHDFPENAMRCAVRLGLVGFEESFANDRLEAAFFTLLEEANNPDLLPALTWMSGATCYDDPNCGTCRAVMSCWYLSQGFA